MRHVRTVGLTVAVVLCIVVSLILAIAAGSANLGRRGQATSGGPAKSDGLERFRTSRR